MRVAILEDEMLTARRLTEMLADHDPAIEVMTVIPSVEKFLRWYRTDVRPDLIFMDIRLEDDNAFSIFEQVRVDAPVVFTTAYDEYMVQAFQSNGIEYLMKPFDQKKLSSALYKFESLREHFVSGLQSQAVINIKPAGFKQRFLATVGTRTRSYQAQDVAYFFVNDKITYLVSRQGDVSPINYSLEWLEEHIDPALFFRVNRQLLVSYGAILQGQNQPNGRMKLEIVPQPHFQVFVSGDRVSEFRYWLGK